MTNNLHTPNDTQAPGPTVASVLRRGYAEYADLPAVVDLSGNVTTYRELGRDARRLVAGFGSLGATKGDRVVVLTKNRSECFTIDHALAIGGFVRVALSYRLHQREVAEIVHDAGARIVIVDGERTSELAAELASFSGRLVSIDDVSAPTAIPFSSLFGDAEAEAVDIRPDDLVWMPYTSGTSGKPKGVMHTHRSLLSILRNILVELPGASTDDFLVHTAPLTHLSGYAMMAYFMRGAQQLALDHFDPGQLLSVVEKHRATVLPLVPTMINMLLPTLESGQYDVSSVHTVIYGGSPIAPDRLARAIKAFGPVFVQSYGLTEMPYNSYLSKQDHDFDPAGTVPERLASAGRVSPFVEMRLMTADGPAADGESGEIQVRGDAAMSGYWNLPAETAETLLEGGWIATGDVGRMTDGFLHVVDRKKDMIVSGGFNVYPTEVENAIYSLPEVAEVAVVGIPDERWGETVHAVIALREGCEVTQDQVEQACLSSIAPYKRPRTVEFVDELPKTGTGKIKRREVKERFWIGRDRLVNG
ncbi:class I adenylate-forming enzyme family protein [Rhodococcus artemisiae]|uniref:AMP-binding protein n=1 Tax=Rhodococcus artemisiae TaxID=714159 RepID=A0ABU7LLA8_9NOCA|nr:AMP-binding protein [Rhodococcus artemisiae]MEE2062009.1 AMP-binding protein [Rhodococcus artemisiae]